MTISVVELNANSNYSPRSYSLFTPKPFSTAATILPSDFCRHQLFSTWESQSEYVSSHSSPLSTDFGTTAPTTLLTISTATVTIAFAAASAIMTHLRVVLKANCHLVLLL